MKERTIYFDVIRIIACLMVVMMHSPFPLKDDQYSPMLGIVTYLSAPCNGLFFMASGALLLGRSLPLESFMKKRLGRIVWPTVLWSLFYITINYFLDRESYDLISQIAWIPFYRTDACGYLWFMYALLGCYFLVPIIEPWLTNSSHREQKIVIGVWLLASIVPMITVYLNIPKFDEHGIWYYWGGFFGYFILGWYIAKNNISWSQIGIAGLLGILLMLLCFKQSSLSVDVNGYLHPYVILFCFAIFASVKRLFCFNFKKRFFNSILSELSACTFGVYLIHYFLLNIWLKHVNIINDLPIEIGILTRWIITIVVGFLIILILRKIPGHKYLIG